MSANHIALQDIGSGPLDACSPLLSDGASPLERISIAARSPWLPSFSWFRRLRINFGRQIRPYSAAETVNDEIASLIGEDFDFLSSGWKEVELRFASVEHIAPWFPKVDPSNTKAQTWRTWRSKRETVLGGCAIAAALVLVANFTSTINFMKIWRTVGDLGTIYRGDCSKAHRLSSGLHIIINVLSTTLLAVSNLCMQLLAAPTRGEIDKAHADYFWLDIGVPSFRNLGRIGKSRRIHIILLAFSSVPLHFLYNSAIIPTVAINTYAWTVVAPNFLEGGAWNASATEQFQMSQQESSTNMTWMLHTWHGLNLQSTIQSMQINANNPSHYTTIDTLDCLRTYSDLLGNRSDVIIVTSAPPEKGNSLLLYGMSLSQTWDIGYALCGFGKPVDCGRLADLPLAQQEQAIRDWEIGDYKIDHCRQSQRSTGNLCSVQYSLSILVVVCICNFIKCVGIVYTACYYANTSERPLSNVGDALCSFLQDPDKSTKGMGIVSKKQIVSNRKVWQTPTAQEYQSRQPRWLHAVSWKRWGLCIGLALAIIIAASIFLATGIAGLHNRKVPTDFQSLVSMGFGAVQPKALVGFITPGPSTRTLYLAVGFSNIWQFMISLLYLVYNSILTAMLVANEWDGFVQTRKSIRVTAPQGIQRSTYFVSVPLKYGLPILAAFGALHFTTSQSVFVVYLTRFFSDGTEDVANRSATSGYSCIAIITSLIIGFTLLLILILFGALRRYRNGAPLASTSSAAISAACHRPHRDAQAHMFEIQWGVVSHSFDNNQSHGPKYDHCSFTTDRNVTGKAKRPEPGRYYV